jgi:hypothetical protein
MQMSLHNQHAWRMAAMRCKNVSRFSTGTK